MLHANTNDMVSIWRKLRAPFTLPQVTAQCHVCEWEKIDIDVLGCSERASERASGESFFWNVSPISRLRSEKGGGGVGGYIQSEQR
jgi:hypothetical protein